MTPAPTAVDLRGCSVRLLDRGLVRAVWHFPTPAAAARFAAELEIIALATALGLGKGTMS